MRKNFFLAQQLAKGKGQTENNFFGVHLELTT
jgi:hypothetical protein